MSKWKRRPDGKTIKRNQGRIGGQFAPRLIDMLESPAFRVLSLAEHRVLARIEIELASHGGLENGNLIVTYPQFVAYGVRRESIPPARRALEALGFIKAKPGRGGNSEFYQPNRYQLTYRHVQAVRFGDVIEPSNDWRRIKTLEEARQIAKSARQEKTETRHRKRRKKKQKSSIRNGTATSAETVLEKGGSAVPNRGVHPQYRIGGYYLDSRGGGGDDGGSVLNPLPSADLSQGCRDGPAPSIAQGPNRAAAPSDFSLPRDETLTAGSSTVVTFPRRAAP
jgi:hypothetical protein